MARLHIEIAHDLHDKVETAQPPRGQLKRFHESVEKLVEELRHTVEKAYPEASVITPHLYSPSGEWLAVRLSWETVSYADDINLPVAVNVWRITNDIRTACEATLADTASWLVTVPYTLETCAECGDLIPDDQPKIQLTFFRPADEHGARATFDVFLHEGCRGDVIEHMAHTIGPKTKE